MAAGVVLTLEPVGDGRVRKAWAALDAAGVRSAASTNTATGYRPHVSLAVFDAAAAMDDALRDAVAGAVGLSLRFGALGVFPGSDGVLFYGAVVTHQLAALQRGVYDVVAAHAHGYWDYYVPGVWIPHCTLATGVRDPAAAYEAIAPLDLPIDTAVESVELVDIQTGAITPLA
jgi:2'-5' RNA ligase